jgi:hypothetical protein
MDYIGGPDGKKDLLASSKLLRMQSRHLCMLSEDCPQATSTGACKISWAIWI